MSLSQNRYHQIKKNSDRLPDFTLNYLELMESCMDNLTNKSNIMAGGNPFSMGQTLFNPHSRAMKGVFKETRVPKQYKNVQYMSKRQQIQRKQQIRQSNQKSDERGDVSNLEQTYTPQITINRLSAVQKSSLRANVHLKKPINQWRVEDGSESGVATVELSRGIDQTGPSTLTQNASNDLDKPSQEYILKQKLSKTGGAFSVARHNKQRSEIIIESDIASTFKSSKPGSPSPFGKTPHQVPNFPIGTPQISVNHQQDPFTPPPQHFKVMDPTQLLKSGQINQHLYRANTSHSTAGGLISPVTPGTYQPFKQYLNNKLLRSNKYKSGNNTPPHIVYENVMQNIGVNGYQMKQIQLPNQYVMANRVSINVKEPKQKPKDNGGATITTTIDIDQYSKQIDSHFQSSSYRNDQKSHSLYSIEEKNSPKNNQNINSSLAQAQYQFPPQNAPSSLTGRRDSHPTLSTDRVGNNNNQRSNPEVAYVPIPLNQIKIVTTSGAGGVNSTNINSGNAQSTSGLNKNSKFLQQNPSQGGKSFKQSQQLGNNSLSGLDSSLAPVQQQLGHRKTIAVSQLQGSHNNPHHVTHSSQGTGAEDDDLMVMMLMQSQLNNQSNIYDYKEEVRSFGENQMKGLKVVPQMPVVARPRQVKGPPLLMQGLQQLSKEDIEHLVPWRYSSKDYFVKAPAPMSPSSLAPKSNALSTQTTIKNIQMDKKTQQQRLFLKDNPQFLAEVQEIMVSSARKTKQSKDNSNPLTSVQEVLQQSTRYPSSPRGAPNNSYQPGNLNQFPQISTKFPPAGHITNTVLTGGGTNKTNSNSGRSNGGSKTNSPRRRRTGQSMYNQVVNVRVNLDYFPSPTMHNNIHGPHGPAIMLQNHNSDERESRTSSATSHLKPSRLKNYHTDVMAHNDFAKNSTQGAGGNSPTKVTTPPLLPVYNQITAVPTPSTMAGRSTIDNDRKNLNQAVFGISLKSHWVFKGTSVHPKNQQDQEQKQEMNTTQTSLLGGGSVLTPQPMKAKVLLQQHQGATK